MFALPLLGGGAWMEAMVHANSINLLTAGLEVMVHAGDRQRGAHAVCAQRGTVGGGLVGDGQGRESMTRGMRCT